MNYDDDLNLHIAWPNCRAGFATAQFIAILWFYLRRKSFNADVVVNLSVFYHIWRLAHGHDFLWITLNVILYRWAKLLEYTNSSFVYLFARECGFYVSLVGNILQDGSKRSNSNSSSNQHWHFKTIPILMAFAKWTIHVQLMIEKEEMWISNWWSLHSHTPQIRYKLSILLARSNLWTSCNKLVNFMKLHQVC